MPPRPELKLVANGLSFPTSLAFDEADNAYIAESGLPFGGEPPGGRVWQLAPHGGQRLLTRDLRPPVSGLVYHQGDLFISEGGHPGRISRLRPNGERQVILDNLPGPGNYHTNTVAFGPDGKLYFSQGAMTNTGIIGLDSYELGWLRRLPHAHDLPGLDVVLRGVNAETPDPLNGAVRSRTRTGAFAPFGTATLPGQRIPAALPCTSAVMRCNPDGGGLELVAWGIRNAFGLGFLPDGRLLAVDQGADDRGSRPLGNAPDLLYEVKPGAWYGWPDFIGGIPITDPRYRPQRGPAPEFLLANHHELPQPEAPLLRFQAHVAAVKFDVAPRGSPWCGQILAALFGDERPLTAPEGPRAGRSVARIDPADWSLHPVVSDPLLRPIDVRFAPGGGLYILDFGRFEIDPARNVVAEARTGRLWRVVL